MEEGFCSRRPGERLEPNRGEDPHEQAQIAKKNVHPDPDKKPPHGVIRPESIQQPIVDYFIQLQAFRSF
jgi:hypothetical protein